jgi:dienelactone hydrolase
MNANPRASLAGVAPLAVLSLTLCGAGAAALEAPPAPSVAPVTDGRLVANLHRPAGDGPFPAVLLLGGSGGGIHWQDAIGSLLAEDGFVALALAYFGMEGLPDALERIPLEYFDEALDHLASQPFVDPTRLGVVGVSKGGELALLLASRDPRLVATVAFVPGSVVFQSIAPAWPTPSSRSLAGEDVPFAPSRITESFRPDRLADMYRLSLDQPAAAAAAIEVERIAGPILLLSGEADALWPSTYMSEQVVARLQSAGFDHPVEHVAYPDAGHLISRVTEETTHLGGTADGNRKAQLDGQQRMREFLVQHLGSRSD